MTAQSLRKRASFAWKILRYGEAPLQLPGHCGTGVSPYIELSGCTCQRCGLHSRHWKERPDCIGPSKVVVA